MIFHFIKNYPQGISFCRAGCDGWSISRTTFGREWDLDGFFEDKTPENMDCFVPIGQFDGKLPGKTGRFVFNRQV